MGKTEAQDTYVVHWAISHVDTFNHKDLNGLEVSLGFLSTTWRFKAGFGGRAVPTKRVVPAHSASFSPPQGAVLPSPLHDKDAEDVKQKKMEEQAEEREAFSMGQHDIPRNLKSGKLSSGKDCVTVQFRVNIAQALMLGCNPLQ